MQYPAAAPQVFQALRIATNKELEQLQQFLPQALDILAPGGRLAVISFHSLEDRMVKQFMTDTVTDCVCPPEFPECRCDHRAVATRVTRKPIVPDNEEIAQNPRSRSAKLRIIQKK
jgi:16S rRNA (cytosine1402-N4)-methyltransferase